MPFDILVVDDEQDIRELMTDILSDEGYNVRVANDGLGALDAVKERTPSVVILDIWLQGSEMDGLAILEVIKKRCPNLPVIMISGHGNIETAINAIRLGAYDYIEKPFKADKITMLIKRAIENVQLKNENDELKRNLYENILIGKSQPVASLRQSIEKVAVTESRVILNGEAGCGKEVLARLIHQKSKRSKGAFVAFHAAFPDKIEEELFGREGRLQNGADANIGKFERAHGGTLFLDEVADIPMDIQAKILKTLQDGSFNRVGGSRKININVRIIASTKKNLQTQIQLGKFREDLFYRLNVVPIRVPSLRERKEDIMELSSYFIGKYAENLGVPSRTLGDGAIAAMEVYEWPGNIRQLRNVIEWLLIMAPHSEVSPISADMLPPELLSSTPFSGSEGYGTDIIGLPLRDARELFEKEYLIAQLERFGCNVSKTAEFVGMERSAFHRKLKMLGVNSKDLRGTKDKVSL